MTNISMTNILFDVIILFSLTVFLNEIYNFVSKGTSMRNILYIAIFELSKI